MESNSAAWRARAPLIRATKAAVAAASASHLWSRKWLRSRRGFVCVQVCVQRPCLAARKYKKMKPPLLPTQRWQLWRGRPTGKRVRAVAHRQLRYRPNGVGRVPSSSANFGVLFS
ncbi:hypothetical protein MRX96_022772 [Rhipicephalus microplus]